MLRYIVTGNPYVKKSNQRVQIRGGKPVKVNTPQYNKWLANALEELAIQKKPDQPIDYPVNLRCHFFKQTHGAVDLSALYEGIQDVLVQIGVLADDNYKIVAGHDGSRVYVDKHHPRMEIEITAMDPDQPEPKVTAIPGDDGEEAF